MRHRQPCAKHYRSFRRVNHTRTNHAVPLVLKQRAETVTAGGNGVPALDESGQAGATRGGEFELDQLGSRRSGDEKGRKAERER